MDDCRDARVDDETNPKTRATYRNITGAVWQRKRTNDLERARRKVNEFDLPTGQDRHESYLAVSGYSDIVNIAYPA